MRYRLIFAALTFFACLAVLIGGFLALLPPEAPEWLQAAGTMAGIVLSLVITNKLVNVPGTKFWSMQRLPEPKETEAPNEGLLVSTEYQTMRYFEVEETEDEGPHYFIALHDGTVLYLNGRYLLQLAPNTFLGIFRRPRKFPCTEFTVVRDRYDGNVAEILCRGTVLEPEAVLPPFKESDMEGVLDLEDGDVITSRTYEELKTARSGNRVSPSGAPHDSPAPR